MKILGISEKDHHSNKKYIIEISAKELQKIHYQIYGKEADHFEALKPGDEIDVSLIYDYYEHIKSMFYQMAKTIKEFNEIKDIVYNFSRIFGPEVEK